MNLIVLILVFLVLIGCLEIWNWVFRGESADGESKAETMGAGCCLFSTAVLILPNQFHHQLCIMFFIFPVKLPFLT